MKIWELFVDIKRSERSSLDILGALIPGPGQGGGRDARRTAARAMSKGRQRYDASWMDAASVSTDHAIWSGVMTAGGARRRWSPLVPSTLPCMG